MFDHTVNPYSPQEIVDIARERNINWLIVKNDLQLEEEPIERKDELMNLLMQQFDSVDSLNNYEIYKRTSADDDDDGASTRSVNGLMLSRQTPRNNSLCYATGISSPRAKRVQMSTTP